MSEPTTRDTLVQAVAVALADPSVKGKPEWFLDAALGRDMTPLAEVAVDRILTRMGVARPEEQS